jgi:hypothetical protein
MGAHRSRPGPKPDPTRPRSRHRATPARGGVVVLPAEGVDWPPPELPPGRAWTDAERDLWRSLWQSPSASQWDDADESAVAMFVVHRSAVLSGTASAWQAQECRHLADRLGLSPQGRQALRWQIGGGGE